MLEQHEDVAGLGERTKTGQGSERRTTQPLYTRMLPGGGFVSVELVQVPGDVRSEHLCGRVVIEPRESFPRRATDAPLVVEELEGDDEGVLMAELFRIARDNAALARRVLRRRSSVPRAD